MILSFFVLMPLLYCRQFQRFYQKAIPVFLLFSVVLWGFRMSETIPRFECRLAWHYDMLKNLESKKLSKVLFTGKHKPTSELLQLKWGLPLESLLLSAKNNIEPNITYLHEESPRKTESKKVFVSCFKTLPFNQMNEQYFQLDTARLYIEKEFGMWWSRSCHFPCGFFNSPTCFFSKSYQRPAEWQ